MTSKHALPLRSSSSPATRRDRGQAVALFSIALTVLLLSVGLAVDGSYAWVQSRQAQNAADMAALAGARVVQLAGAEGFDDGDVASAIADLAAANGTAEVEDWGTTDGPMYTDGSGLTIAGAYVGNGCTTQSCALASSATIPAGARGVSVGATQGWSPFFLGLIGISDWSASAHAVARYEPGDPGAGGCAICILSGGTAGANSVVLTANQGSIMVRGNTGGANSSRLTANGGSIIVDGNLGGGNSVNMTANDGSILVSGNLSGSNSSRFQASSGAIQVGGNLSLTNSSQASGTSVSVAGTVSLVNSSSTTPGASPGGPVSVTIDDPLASLSDPVNPNPSATPQSASCVNSCTQTITPANGVIQRVTVSNSSTVTLGPGLYSQVTLTNSSRANLMPGTYYFAGSGGIASADNSSRFVGLGPVTLIFLDQTRLSVANSAGLQISAPAAGQLPNDTYPYPGMAIYAARGNTSTFSLANSSSYPLTGTIYGRDATLTTVNSSAVHLNSHVVVATYQAANSSSLNVTYAAVGSAPSAGRIKLVQ